MVKITFDLISRSSQFLNPLKEFHLDLRGYKITVIENLSATNDQFGCIDFSDNSITKVDLFPKLNRLRTVLLINNRVSSVEKDFAINCPYLENLILTNNKISSITEIDNIATCKTLVRLSLVDNLVTKLKYYRLYAIFKMPNLRVLDFQKIRLKEKLKAKMLFESQEGKEIIQNLIDKKYNEEEESEFTTAIEQIKQDEKNKMRIYNLIQSTNTLEEFQQLEGTLLGEKKANEEVKDVNEEDVENNPNPESG